jgi:hypothetical protein
MGITTNPTFRQGGCLGGVRGTRVPDTGRPLNVPTPKVPFKGPLGALSSSMCHSSCRAHSQQPPPPPLRRAVPCFRQQRHHCSGRVRFRSRQRHLTTTAFTFAGEVYQILTVPSSNVSIVTGINGAGLIVGVYEDLASVRHGFAKSGGTFSNVDFPGLLGRKPSAQRGRTDRGRLRGRRQRRTWLRQ